MTDIILDIIGRNIGGSALRQVSVAKGGEWASPCPVCGGKDRFRSWPNQEGGDMARRHGISGTWWCRQCDKGGDVFDLLKFAEGLDFPAACRAMRIEMNSSGHGVRSLRQPKPAPVWKPVECKTPSEQWRSQATKMAGDAYEHLLQYPPALTWLARRGLPIEAVRRYGLGYFQGEGKTGTCLYRARSAFGLADITKNGKSHTALWIPRGLAIPLWRPGAQQTNDVHRIRIRRPRADLKEGDPKYMLLTGSGQAPMVLPPEGVSPGMAPWVVVEAELDAMAVHFACRMKVGVVAVLTNRGKPDDVAHKWLSRSPVILGALDFDPPGKKGERPGYQGWVWWEQTYAKARRWPVPSGKDPGEAFQKGVDLAAWINAGLPASLAFLDGNGKPGRSVVSDAPLGAEGAPPASVPVRKTSAAADSRRLNQETGSRAFPPEKTVQKTLSVRRWDGATKDTPLSDVRFPHGFRYSLDYLIKYYAGKSVDDALLVLCPRTTPAWYWLSFNRYCGKCSGHSHCLVDFLTSPQMRAESVELEIADAH